LVGGVDADFILGQGGNDKLVGLFGGDYLSGGEDDDHLDGGFQSDTLSGDDGKDTLEGASGDDTFIGGAQGDNMSGGLGNDLFSDYDVADYNGDTIDGGLGTDTMHLSLYGADSGIDFTAQDAVETVNLYGAEIHDIEQYQIEGSDSGADKLTGGRWNDTFFGNGGDDNLDGAGGADYLNGGDGNDTVYGGDGEDVLSGGDDDDVLNGGNMRDALYGEDGNDKLVAGAGDDYMDGGIGNDTLNGGVGDDYIITGDGKDQVIGGAGDDDILMTMGTGKKTIDGGTGADKLELRNVDGDFIARDPSQINTLADGSTIKNIESYDVYGTDNDNVITTLGGDDELVGYDGNDTLRAGAGNDTLHAGDGNDKLFGEAGNDTMFAEGAKDTLDGGAGTDSAWIYVDSLDNDFTFKVVNSKGTLSNGTTASNTEIFNIFTGDGNDTLDAGNAKQVWFKANDGNDKLTGGVGDDYLDSGLGNDTVSGGRGDDQISDLGGSNSLVGGDGNDEVEITVFDQASDGLSKVELGKGNDTVEFNAGLGGLYGSLRADGGAGEDLAYVSRSDSTKALTFVLNANATLVNGDAMLMNFERVHIDGGSGADSFTGGKLSDTFEGNDGNDKLVGLDGDDWLYGGAGKDNLTGGNGNDHLYSGNLAGETDADKLDAGAGNDDVYINNGDVAVGGRGVDTVNVDVSVLTTGVTFTLTGATVKVNSETSFSGMELLDFTGTSGDDNVTGGSRGDTLWGNAGDDTMRSMGGNDALYDGAGDDKLYGGAGNDQIVRNEFTGHDLFDGGAGKDSLSFDYNGDLSVVLDLADNSRNDGLALGLTVKSFETILGTSRDDDIRGDSANQYLSGGGGDDVLDGRDGNDTLAGGGAGDLMTGGKGNDVFVFYSGLDGGDEITDFTHGQDKISVDNIGFGLDADDHISLTLSEDVKFGKAGAGFLFETDTHRLWFDADGKGGDSEAVLLATLDNVKSLSVSDFILA
jgi:Ca2+-binding RTX toxin-like protein